jgi:hypothetical protein
VQARDFADAASLFTAVPVFVHGYFLANDAALLKAGLRTIADMDEEIEVCVRLFA